MTNEQPDFYKWMQDLTAQSVAEQTRAFQRYNELMQRMLHGDLNDPGVREEYARFMREEAARYASDLAQLSLGYYSALLELGRNYSDRFFAQVLHSRQPDGRPSQAAEPGVQPRQVTLDLHGAAGQEVDASFVIENKRNTPAEISFVVSEFVDAAGGSPFRAPLRLQPAQFSLGPLQEAAVNIRLPLPREQFVPGHQYRSTVIVHGYDELELLLCVRLDPEAAPAAAPGDGSQSAGPETETPAPARRPRQTGKHAAKRREKKATGSRP